MSDILHGISVTVNGEAMPLPAGTMLAALLARLGLDMRKVAVELNKEIVPRSTYDEVRLIAGDVLEIVNFVGGG